jgi:hypothetical protein
VVVLSTDDAARKVFKADLGALGGSVPLSHAVLALESLLHWF